MPAEPTHEPDGLVQGLDGTDSAEDIRVQAPKEPEVNPEIYRDVEPLIFRGFLTISATINDVHFVFKSTNQHEMEMIRLSMPGTSVGAAPPQFWNLFLAYGVFMVDGVNILPDRDHWLPKISGMFKELQASVKAKIVRHLSEINRRASNAVAMTECYATEKYSRYRWLQCHGMDMASTSVTGVGGSSSLGLNWAQLTWRALNRIEDLHHEQEQVWENAKFVGSCLAGKGLSKIYQQDVSRRQKEREETWARKDLVLRQVLLGEKPVTLTKEGHATLIVAKTVDELADQLEKSLRGERDWHDQIVAEHEKKVRDAYASRQQQIQQMAKEREAEFHGKPLLGGTELRGLSFSQVQQHMMRRQQELQTQQATPQSWPELTDERLVNTLEKHFGPEPTETTSEINSTDRDPSMALPVAIPRTPGTPFRRK